MTEHGFLANYGHAFRALEIQGEAPSSAARRLHDLHTRYEREFIAVLDDQLRQEASFNNRMKLDPTSLLAMVGPGTRGIIAESAQCDSQSPAVPSDAEPPLLQQVVLALDEQKRCVLFQGGAVLRGVAYDLLARLVHHRHQFLRGGAPRTVSIRILLEEFDIAEETLRRRVARARKEFEGKMELIWGFPPDLEDLIQSGQWQGYRLNPNVLILGSRLN